MHQCRPAVRGRPGRDPVASLPSPIPRSAHPAAATATDREPSAGPFRAATSWTSAESYFPIGYAITRPSFLRNRPRGESFILFARARGRACVVLERAANALEERMVDFMRSSCARRPYYGDAVSEVRRPPILPLLRLESESIRPACLPLAGPRERKETCACRPRRVAFIARGIPARHFTGQVAPLCAGNTVIASPRSRATNCS